MSARRGVILAGLIGLLSLAFTLAVVQWSLQAEFPRFMLAPYGGRPS